MQYRKLNELKKLPNNPRIIRDKQFKTLCDSIRDNPKYFEARPIILSDRTGSLVIIAGNQRYEAAKSLKLKEVPTFLIEGLDEAKEREIIIRDNISNGEFDFDLLANGWDDLPLADWGVPIPNFTDPNEEWKGMPEFGNEPKAFKTLYVHFETQDDVENFAEFIGQTIGEKTKYIWYPEKERQDLKGQSFENES